MKKTPKDFIEIALTLAIIAGLFMPYLYGVLPIDAMLENFKAFDVLLSLTIPILFSFPFLLMLMFKPVIKGAILKWLKLLFFIIYILVLGNYGYGFYNTFNSWIFDESLGFLISIPLSLLLLLLSLKYVNTKIETLKYIALSIMTFPIVFYYVSFVIYDFEDFNYGGYIINFSFISLYGIAVYTIFKNRKLIKAP